jgi:hypothetical protein
MLIKEGCFVHLVQRFRQLASNADVETNHAYQAELSIVRMERSIKRAKLIRLLVNERSNNIICKLSLTFCDSSKTTITSIIPHRSIALLLSEREREGFWVLYSAGPALDAAQKQRKERWMEWKTKIELFLQQQSHGSLSGHLPSRY